MTFDSFRSGCEIPSGEVSDREGCEVVNSKLPRDGSDRQLKGEKISSVVSSRGSNEPLDLMTRRVNNTYTLLNIIKKEKVFSSSPGSISKEVIADEDTLDLAINDLSTILNNHLMAPEVIQKTALETVQLTSLLEKEVKKRRVVKPVNSKKEIFTITPLEETDIVLGMGFKDMEKEEHQNTYCIYVESDTNYFDVLLNKMLISFKGEIPSVPIKNGTIHSKIFGNVLVALLKEKVKATVNFFPYLGFYLNKEYHSIRLVNKLLVEAEKEPYFILVGLTRRDKGSVYNINNFFLVNTSVLFTI